MAQRVKDACHGNLNNHLDERNDSTKFSPDADFKPYSNNNNDDDDNSNNNK